MKKFKINKKEEKPGRILELEIEVSKEYVDGFKSDALKSIGKEIEIKGFRKGTAPANLVEENIKPSFLKEETIRFAVSKISPEILQDEKLEPIVEPTILIKEMLDDKPVLIKMIVTLFPVVELSEYKKIAKEVEKENVKVEEKEVTDYIDYLRDRKKPEGEEKSPEFNDEFVKTLGYEKTAEDFKKEVTENMLAEKKQKAAEKRRVAIIEKIISESKIDIPEILIEYEIDRMMGQFMDNIKQYKIDPETYLKEIKKTEEDLRKEWRADAEKRAKMHIVLPEISKKEKIKVDEAKVDEEVKHIISHHPEVSEERAKVYITSTMTNEEVFKFLENL